MRPVTAQDFVTVGPPGVDPEFYEENLLNEYQIPSKEDKMMSPVNRSNTFYYEPQQARLTSISVNDPPVRDTYTMYNQHRRSQSVSPRGYYNQSFFPYHKPGGAGVREDIVLNSFAKSMEGKQPLPNNYQYSFHKYPFTTRQPRKVALGEEYVHQHSMFMLTTPRCTGHFIIHPDWVSERSGMKRSRSFIQSRRNLDGLRY